MALWWAAMGKSGSDGGPSDVLLLLFSKISGAKMSDLRGRKAAARNLRKPAPGCMGRIIHILDLNAGTARTKVLTDRSNRDGNSATFFFFSIFHVLILMILMICG